jgi:hypothetical protein
MINAVVVALSVALGARCYDVRAHDGGCLTAQSVALVGRFGEVHGSFLANYFGQSGGVVVGASWGGDLGTPFWHFAHDRVRFAARLTLDMGVIRRAESSSRSESGYDLQWATFVAGPQLWLRVSQHAFFLVRIAAGGTLFLFEVVPPLASGPLGVTPTVDAALGFAFDLQ